MDAKALMQTAQTRRTALGEADDGGIAAPSSQVAPYSMHVGEGRQISMTGEAGTAA